MNPTIRLDVFSDIACPFCYIGETRLARVLTAYPNLNLEWHWHPFQLQPNLPPRGVAWDVFSQQKFGGVAQRQAAFAQVVQTAANEGLVFDFDQMPVAPNTLEAHRLVMLASGFGLGKPMAMRLYKGYFSECQDITDVAILTALGLEVGVPEEAMQQLFSSDTFIHEVHNSQLEAGQMGIGGVPFFIFNLRLAVSGAQPVEVFHQAIEAALKEV